MLRFTLAFFVLGYAGLMQVQAQSSCHLREMDLCAASLLVLAQSPQGAAVSDADIDRQCTFIKEADQCFRNYTERCATPLQQEIADMLFDGADKLQKEYCTKGTKLRTMYLKNAGCINEAMKDNKPCIKDLQSGFEAVTSAKWDKRLPLGCCSYHKMRSCVGTIIRNKCGQESVDFMSRLMKLVLSRLPELLCDEYDLKSSHCDEINNPPLNRPKSKSTSILNRLLSAYVTV